MDENLKELIINNSDSIVDSWMNEVGRIKAGNYTASISDELYENTNREFVNVIFTSIQNQGSSKVVEEFSEKIINLGWPLSYITDGLQIFRRVTIDFYLHKQIRLIRIIFQMS